MQPVALGVLSKFNYVILPIALLISAISLHSTREALKPSRRSTPFPAIAAAIADRYPEAKTVFVKNKWIGGNFRYLNKNWNSVIPGKNPAVLTGEVLFVRPNLQANIPRVMAEYLKVQNKKIAIIDPLTTVKFAYSAESKSLFTMNFTAVRLK